MWYKACENPHAFSELYASGEDLDRVELFEVTLHPDGRHLRLRVQLPRYPDHPPGRWHPEANAVQVVVDFWSIGDLTIEGWSHEAIGQLTLARDGDGLRLAFASDAVRITARCESARIDRFHAYTDAGPDPQA
jgi:hypothetical protein